MTMKRDRAADMGFDATQKGLNLQSGEFRRDSGSSGGGGPERRREPTRPTLPELIEALEEAGLSAVPLKPSTEMVVAGMASSDLSAAQVCEAYGAMLRAFEEGLPDDSGKPSFRR